MTLIIDTKSQKKWNNIYSDQSAASFEPSRILLENEHLFPKEGKALDLACGLGADAFFLASRGLRVEAWDISDVVVDKINTMADKEGLSVQASARDLSNISVEKNSFDLINIAHYLDRSLVNTIVHALAPGGLLFYQTFTQTVTDAYSGPGNPDFRLSSGELLELFSDLKLLVYREEALVGDVNRGFRNEALFIGQKPRAGS